MASDGSVQAQTLGIRTAIVRSIMVISGEHVLA
jgi:hypothetical protein